MNEDLNVGMDLNEEVEIPVETEVADQDDSIGNIKISVEVVAKIASIAATEIEGVSCMRSNFVNEVAQKLGAKKSGTQGVKVEIAEDMATIDLYLVVDYGVKIPELAWNVQEKVKESVEAMTGLAVTAVNIHIEGINFEKDTEAESIEE